MDQLPPAFWNLSAADLLKLLESVKEGLTSSEAKKRLALYGANLLKPPKRSDVLTDRESVVGGKRVDLGGRRFIKKKTHDSGYGESKLFLRRKDTETYLFSNGQS